MLFKLPVSATGALLFSTIGIVKSSSVISSSSAASHDNVSVANAASLAERFLNHPQDALFRQPNMEKPITIGHFDPYALPDSDLHLSRKLEEDDKSDNDDTAAVTCDVQFIDCIKHPKCTSCFAAMEQDNIDWSIVAPNTPCNNVLDALMDKAGICKDLKKEDTDERNVFCSTFDKCVIWKTPESDDGGDKDGGDNNNNNDNGDDNGGKKKKNKKIDCDSLTSCEFEGFKKSYLGDGVCHERLPGCYNHKICGYDNGDCCADTCKNSTDLAGCGTDGYYCRDPASKFCITCDDDDNNTNGNGNGKKKNKSDVTPAKANCTDDQTPYKLLQYDSFGDGWDVTEMIVKDKGDGSIPYDGRLESGSEGLEYICLSATPSCYSVSVEGGFWGNEVSWQIKPMKNGAPEIAGGGAPMECDFPVAGGKCELSCSGRPNVDPAKDKKYQTWHKMVNCIEEKCVIPMTICEKDLVCLTCLEDDTPSYCLANDKFNALAFCSECNCVETTEENAEKKKQYCKEKSRDKHENEPTDDEDDDDDGDIALCSFDEFMGGSNAVVQYSMCSGVDTLSSLLVNFDPDNFGMLDAFESCASEYTTSHDKSALECMQILENAIHNPTKGVDPKKKNVPARAIAQLASDLLHNAKNFCECSSAATKAAPVCADFIHFKTLLYESIDGCKSLDAIDCGAWAEFYSPCKVNMEEKFGGIDFGKKEQCDYIHDRCGNVGPFPSFRNLDCDSQIGEAAWDFYLDYSKSCVKDEPKPRPSPSPPRPAPATPSRPTYGTLQPTVNKSKKYVPPEEKGHSKRGGFRKFILLCLVLGGAYWFYKKRYGSFDYSQFRRTRNYGPQPNGEEMYNSLTLESSTNFEPPSLPPAPSSYGQPMNAYNGFA